MKKIIVNLRSLAPYLLLILLYFIFINFEAKRSKNNKDIKVINNKSFNMLNTDKNNNIRISIPVIPYKE
tara:strand:+ start:249 stop:455 length:207 start_codon:yes stop_codon:yes gene_type:complete